MRNPGRIATRLGITLITLTLVAVGLATTASGQTNASHSDVGHVLRYRIQFSPQNVIDVPARQSEAGDYRASGYTVFRDVLTDESGKEVGTEGGTSMVTQVDATGARSTTTWRSSFLEARSRPVDSAVLTRASTLQ
jgi:hypothetical protein